MKTRAKKLLQEVQHHLHIELLPFWTTHGPDPEYGGFLTYFDKQGNPTGETIKTLLCQARMIYAYASAHRAGYGDRQFLDMAREGAQFLAKKFWDNDYEGWYWTCERDGTPCNSSKLTYGGAFVTYAFTEYQMASAEPEALETALEGYELLQTRAADNCYGGYYEFLERDWSKKPPGKYGGDRKSFDVHMHVMEAFANLYEATGEAFFRDKTRELIDLIVTRILHREFGTGIAQFSLDWTPVRQILFTEVWGADRASEDPEGRPLDNTSYGHNIEFAWLLHHALDTLGLDVAPYAPILKKIFDHTLQYGVDRQRGGLYCEGPHDGPARERNKEFWQQAEAMVGFLDAYRLFDDKRYLDAYENIHRFVMDHMIDHEVGEWRPLLDEYNTPVWDYMAHGWKINYHTVRSMIQCETRLKRIAG